MACGTTFRQLRYSSDQFGDELKRWVADLQGENYALTALVVAILTRLGAEDRRSVGEVFFRMATRGVARVEVDPRISEELASVTQLAFDKLAKEIHDFVGGEKS